MEDEIIETIRAALGDLRTEAEGKEKRIRELVAELGEQEARLQEVRRLIPEGVKRAARDARAAGRVGEECENYQARLSVYHDEEEILTKIVEEVRRELGAARQELREIQSRMGQVGLQAALALAREGQKALDRQTYQALKSMETAAKTFHEVLLQELRKYGLERLPWGKGGSPAPEDIRIRPRLLRDLWSPGHTGGYFGLLIRSSARTIPLDAAARELNII